MKNRKYLSGFIAVAFVLVLFTGCGNHGEQNSTETDGVKKPSTTSDIVVRGEVKYNNEYQINIDFPAKIEDIKVKEGDIVKKGSTLITFSSDDYQANVKKLQLQADSNKAALNQVNQAALEADIEVLKKQIEYKTAELRNGNKPELLLLQNSLTRAEKEVKDAQDDVDKYQQLYAPGVIAQVELDKYKDVLNLKQKAKKDAVDTIANTKRTLQEELDGLNSSLKYKKVQLNQQKNAADAAQVDLDAMTDKMKKPYLSGNDIVSHLDYGIVKEISVVKGASVGIQNAAQPVIDLIDGESLCVSAEVPEEFIRQISQDSKVTIIPTADKNLKIDGHIIRFANEAVEKDGDRIVKVQVKPDDKNNILKPGFTADVQFSRTGK